MSEDSMQQRMEQFAQVCTEFDAESFEELAGKAKDADEDVRVIAAARLINLDDTRAIPILMTLLDDPSSRVRGMAAIGLGHYEVAEARDKLLDHLRNDEIGDVRAMCARSLGEIGGADEEIIRALADPSHHVKTAAAVSLSSRGVSKATGEIAKLLHDPNWEVRYFAGVALMDLGKVSPEVVAAFESLWDIPEALDTLESFAETDVMMEMVEKYPDDLEALEDADVDTTLDTLRRKYGENEVPFPSKDPLGDLISQAKSMLAG